MSLKGGKKPRNRVRYVYPIWLLIFLACLPATAVAGHFPVPAVNTPWAASYIGYFKINGVAARPGDEVAFFDPQGVLSGLAVVTNPGTYGSVAVYGDDPDTSPDEGATAGDILTVKIWDAQAAVELAGSTLILSKGPQSGDYAPSAIPPIWQDQGFYVLNIDTATHFPRPQPTPLVSDYIVNLTLKGQPAETGDEIAVFDSQGVLAGHIVIGQDFPLAVYGDDPDTPSIDEGAESGEVLTFKIWDKSAGMEYSGGNLVLSPGEPIGSYLASNIPPVWNEGLGYILHIEVTAVVIPPDTTITSQPNNPSSRNTATFEFQATETGYAFQCRLDGGQYEACTSPHTYTGLAEGSHTFYVRALDAIGNADQTPASFTWTVDTLPPDTTITSQPNNPSNSTTATFKFTASETGSTFQCQLDEGQYQPCTSPWTYTGLTIASHTFSVKAADLAGNTASTPASYTWNIDVTAPSSSITSLLDGTTIIGTTYAIKGTASDVASQVQKVEVSTDGGSTWNLTVGTSTWTYEWTIPGDGSYLIKSRATDTAGNVEVPGPGITVTVYQRQPSNVTLSGRQLLVNGEPFTVRGVGYSPVPIGEDPEISPPFGDYFTSEYSGIYERDLPQLRELGANTVRLWNWQPAADHRDFLDKAHNQGVKPIYVIAGYWLNSGLDIDPNSPNNVRAQIKAEFRAMVAAHKNYPALLMWTIGNELNADWMYGGSLDNLFSLLNEMAEEAHAEEGEDYHPVTTALLDKNLITTVAVYDAAVPSLDIWGANVYRGNTFGNLFTDYEAASNKPLIILEYGIDAFDKVHGTEYEYIGRPYQAEYAENLWKEIAANASVTVGGSIMAYSDEWWKGKHSTDSGCPETLPFFHGTCGYASPSHTDGYANEEWWGIMRVKDNGSEPDIVKRRAVFYALQALWYGVVRGDVDKDNQVNLSDAVLALQVLAGMHPPGIRQDYVTSRADVNGDNRLGLEEVVYILQMVATIR